MATFLEQARWMLQVLGVNVGGDTEPEPVISAPVGGVGSPPKAPPKSTRNIAQDVEMAEGRLLRQLDGGAGRPTDILDRRAYINSENRSLRQRVAEEAPEEQQAALRKRIDGMDEALVNVEAESMRRAAEALRKEVATAKQAVAAAQLREEDLPDNKKRVAAYKAASTAAAELFLSATDWDTQLKAAKSLPGASDLVAPLAELKQQNLLLDAAIGRLLPKLSSKPKATASDEVVVEATRDEDKVVVGREVEAIIACGGDWADAKAKYGRFKNEMQKLADFRKKLVDKWLTDNLTPWGMAVGTGLGWVAVGSTDPTSDYDISINKHGTQGTGSAQKIKYDYEIVKEFNAHFRGVYGCETGTLFDTNLYASAPPLLPGPPPEGNEKEQEAYADVLASQDIGALMKQRRYMSAAEFNAYREDVLSGIPEPAKAKMAQRFDRANDNFLISQLSTVETMRSLLKKAGEDRRQLSEGQAKALEIIEHWEANQGSGGGTDGIAAALELEHVAHQLLHECKDASTMATNEIYAESTGSFRQAEANVAALKKVRDLVAEILKSLNAGFDAQAMQGLLEGLALELGPLDQGAAEHVRKGIASGEKAGFVNALINAQDRVDAIAPGLLSDLGRAQALNMFFANEAYQSGGPFRHVVYAGQAVETDVKKEFADKGITPSKELLDARIKEVTKQRRAELSPEERLDSFNEQLGDFLKDLAHYGDADPGVAIIQSSKYLDRLIDAAALLDEKKLFDADPALKGDIQKEVSRQQDIRNQLIAARKGKLEMVPPEGGEESSPPIDQVEQRRAFACEFMRKLGIVSVAALGQTYTALGVRVNVAVRKQIAA